jgi:O-antigen ligase
MLGSSDPDSTSAARIAQLVLSAGAVAVVLAALPYKAFDLDRYFVPKELVLHVCAATAAFLCITAWRRVTLTVVDLLLAAFLVAGVISAAFAVNLWAAERALAISLSGVALFWVAATLRSAGLARPLLVALATGVVVAAATSLAQAYGVETEYFSLNRAPGGTFGNRNFIAHLAAIGTPIVVLVALTARRGLGSLFGGLGMATIAAALVLSRSRAAWLAVIALAVPVGALAFLTRRRWREPRTVRRLMVLGASAVAGAVAAVVIPNRLEWKSDSPYLDSAAGLVNYKQGSGRGRLVQYSNSLRMTQAQPLFGVGPGNWPVAYPKFASRNDPSLSQEDGVVSNPWPSSDWVAYLAERGVIGFALLLAAMLGLFGRAVRDLRSGQTRDPDRVLTAIALVGTLVATAVVGTFDAVLLIAAPTFFFWTLAGALAPPGKGAITFEVRKLGPALVVALGVLTIARSTTQLAAMAVYSTSSKLSALDLAARLDPGSYRIRLRLAQAYKGRGDCVRARTQARAARDLFPNAGEPKRILNACGGR